jgi:hypothetical protein
LNISSIQDDGREVLSSLREAQGWFNDRKEKNEKGGEDLEGWLLSKTLND